MMAAKIARSFSLAQKFYLMLVVPLVLISALVTWVTYRGLDSNAADLATALRVQNKTNRALSLLLTQDDASKALLIDPAQLEVFSGKKIAAYDEHKKLLSELSTELSSDDMRQILMELATLDETKLRPIDSKILEQLFENPDKARALYFTDYEPHRVEYEKGIRKLASLGTLMAENAGIELAAKNIHSLLQISLALVLGIVVVATTITVLSRQIERSNENTRSLLAVLSEGLFFFDRNGEMASERSQALSRIIPGSDGVKTLQHFVTEYANFSLENVQACLKLLWNEDGDDFLSDFESTISLLPRTLTIDGTQIVNLEYRPLYGSDGQLEKVVVVSADVTEQLKNEREAIAQAERVRKISRVATSVESYQSFFEEASSLFTRADGIISTQTISVVDLTQLRRDLHTIKGSIGTFEFTSLAHEIHNLETLLEEEGVGCGKFRPHWERIKDQWKTETIDIEAVLGLKENQSKLTMAKAKFERLTEYSKTATDSVLGLLLSDCLRVPLKEVFAKYESYLDKLMERRAEKQVCIAYMPNSCELAYSEIQRLDSAFVHLVRNCLDHGIEDKDVRLGAGKPASGTIQLACYRKKNNTLHFVVKDDGQGINGDKLAEKAAKSGVWTSTQAAAASYQEKIELIFVPNLSTKDTVTEISGRGVGMDAVKALLEELGGSISVYSQPGLGTQFEFGVPAMIEAIQYNDKVLLAAVV